MSSSSAFDGTAVRPFIVPDLLSSLGLADVEEFLLSTDKHNIWLNGIKVLIGLDISPTTVFASEDERQEFFLKWRNCLDRFEFSFDLTRNNSSVYYRHSSFPQEIRESYFSEGDSVFLIGGTSVRILLRVNFNVDDSLLGNDMHLIFRLMVSHLV
jgi:hypothetical protein